MGSTHGMSLLTCKHAALQEGRNQGLELGNLALRDSGAFKKVARWSTKPFASLGCIAMGSVRVMHSAGHAQPFEGHADHWRTCKGAQHNVSTFKGTREARHYKHDRGYS